MHGLLWIMLLAGRGPVVAKPTSVAKPANPGAAVAPLQPAILTPGNYPLRRGVADDAAPALEAVAAQMSASLPPPPDSKAWIQPRYVSEKVLYSRLPLGDAGRGVLIALDESTGTGYGYDRLYFDAGLDANLAA